jgi:hypothetical protein
MARFEAKNTSRAELDRVFRQIMARNNQLLKRIGTTQVRALFDGGEDIRVRAQEILREKGHYVSGNLFRSLNTQIIAPGGRGAAGVDPGPCRERLQRARGEEQPIGRSRDDAAVEVGTSIEYAACVEGLDDGGYLFPASEEKFDPATETFSNAIQGELKRWSAGGG